jgi:STE24 endopeptidase
MVFKISAIVIIIIVSIFNLWIAYLRLQSVNNEIPENVADIYNAQDYARWQEYRKEKVGLDIITEFVTLTVNVLLFAFNVYAIFAGLFPQNTFMQLFSVILFSTLTEIFVLPFDYYDTMKIEEKYGFNKTTKGTFFLDKIKEMILVLVLMTLITWVLALLHRSLGDYMILVFAGVLILLILAIVFLFPFFTRIFNKFTPLEDGELRSRLTELLEKHGYKVREIEVMDASKRSTKANAYFAGFGKTKSIVLYDTILEKLTPEEICAVFAHELGHGVHHDTTKGQIFTAFQMILISVLAWLTLRYPEVFRGFGFDDVNYGFAVILIMSVELSLISPLIGLIQNAISRSHEYNADRFAVNEGYGKALISGLKKIVRDDFGDVAPSKALIFLMYDHPSLSQRITAIERYTDTN